MPIVNHNALCGVSWFEAHYLCELRVVQFVLLLLISPYVIPDQVEDDTLIRCALLEYSFQPLVRIIW